MLCMLEFSQLIYQHTLAHVLAQSKTPKLVLIYHSSSWSQPFQLLDWFCGTLKIWLICFCYFRLNAHFSIALFCFQAPKQVRFWRWRYAKHAIVGLYSFCETSQYIGYMWMPHAHTFTLMNTYLQTPMREQNSRS